MWNQEWRRPEPRTGLSFQFVPGTVSLEEFEWQAVGLGLLIPLRVVHELDIGRRYHQAIGALRDCLESNRQKLGGVPVFRGTRFSASQFLAELADSDAVPAIADEFEVKQQMLQAFLHALAVYFDRPTASR
jgi:uncharacterized protein (DUF433 family)